MHIHTPLSVRVSALISLVLCLFISACQSTSVSVAIPEPGDDHCADSSGCPLMGYDYDPLPKESATAAQREVAALDDSREKEIPYPGDGKFNFNPGMAEGPKPIRVANAEQFLEKRIVNPTEVYPVETNNFKYRVNENDILARHTFVLAGLKKTGEIATAGKKIPTFEAIGHHVALFESRHQHHGLVKLKFDFSDPEIIGKSIQEMLGRAAGTKKPVKGPFFAVTVSKENVSFELVRIPTGTIRRFKGKLVETNVKGVLLDVTGQQFDVMVEILELLHFNRMYVNNDKPENLRYIAHPNAADEGKTMILTHLVQGRISEDKTAYNFEQMLQVRQPGGKVSTVPAGSILLMKKKDGAQDRPAQDLLKPKESGIRAIFTREGTKELINPNASGDVELEVVAEIYKRPIPLDDKEKQDDLRKKLAQEFKDNKDLFDAEKVK